MDFDSYCNFVWLVAYKTPEGGAAAALFKMMVKYTIITSSLKEL